MGAIRTDEAMVSPACFRQRVNLPSAQVAGLTEEELAAALCFEVEPFSGISRAAGELAWKRVNGTDAVRAIFDVVQIRTTDLAEVLAAAKKEKRVVRAVTAVPETGESLEALPWIPAKRARGRRARGWVLWWCVCACVAAGLAWDAWTQRRETATLEREVVLQRRLRDEKDALLAKIARAQQEANALRERRMAETQAQQNAEVLRAAWGLLLEAVPGACADEGVVTGVVATGAFSAQLKGVALSAEAAARIVVRLTEALKSPKSAWVVRPGALGAAADGGTVGFACELVFDPEGQFK